MDSRVNPDLSAFLRHWPYEPGEIKARKIRDAQGEEKLQMRVDLGVLQMEMRGRPDGQRPFGYESYCDYHQARLERYVEEHGDGSGFVLSPEECSQLRLESLQYYYRYLSLYALADYGGVCRDTEHNLALFDLVRTYADEEEDRFLLEQYRPYVIMMHTRARAHLRLKDQEAHKALEDLIAGINRIQAFFEEMGQRSLSEECEEVALLREMAEEILRAVPQDPLGPLRDEMKAAVAREDYERAAALRDEIRRLEASPHPK